MCIFTSSMLICVVHAITAWEVEVIYSISLAVFTTVQNTLCCLLVSLTQQQLAALGNENMSNTELCSPLPRTFGSNKITNAEVGYCIFPPISLEVMGNVPGGLSCNLVRDT